MFEIALGVLLIIAFAAYIEWRLACVSAEVAHWRLEDFDYMTDRVESDFNFLANSVLDVYDTVVDAHKHMREAMEALLENSTAQNRVANQAADLLWECKREMDRLQSEVNELRALVIEEGQE